MPWRAPVPLVIAFVVFLVVLAYLVAASLVHPAVAEFVPDATGPRERAAIDTVTLDATDEQAWRFFAFRSGEILVPPDTAGWDLGVRRYHVVTSGAVADAGAVPFDSLRVAPAGGYVATTFGRDTTNAVVSHWYRYNFISHLLTPNDHLFVVRTAGGAIVKLAFLSYYCPGVTPGCVTFRYAYGEHAFPLGR